MRDLDREAVLLGTMRELAAELRPGRRPPRVSLDAAIERDLGFGSLARAELFRRVERAFGARLPDGLLAGAETPRDLLRALAAAGSAPDPAALTAAPLAEPAEAAPESTRTLPEVLAWHAERHPERRHVLFEPGDGTAEELTYGVLRRRARAMAAALREQLLAPGETVALMLPTGLEYFACFLGIQLAGGVPVPIYPPARPGQLEDHLRRQAAILRTAGCVTLIAAPEVLPLARLLRAMLPALREVVTPARLAAAGDAAAAAPLPPVAEGDVAFLQFTSGSTGDPKGVVLTHANLLANLRAIGQGIELLPEDVVVSWLPLYHDMGLIGTWMGSLYYGMPLVLLPPTSFLARPARWLQAISRHRGTLSAAPNFAYELCVRKVDDGELAGLDLACWRLALNGAEPVSPETLRRFAERFAPLGFRAAAMKPVYGLAECSLALCFPAAEAPPRIDAVARAPFARDGRALPAAAGDPRPLRFVSCGLPLPGHEVRIVGADGRELPERREGRLEFRAPSATSGYFGNPAATARLVRGGGWLDSGDLAYVAGGEVFVTGRVKDVILVAGRNLYPQELEEAVGELPGARKGCVAAFGRPDPAAGTERLVVVAETREAEEPAREGLREAIRRTTVDLLGTPPDDVVLAPPGTVPKTSSGKLRRTAARELYLRGRLGRRRAAPAVQLAQLAWSGARPQLARWRRRAGESLYAAWAWLLFGLFAAPAFLGVCLLPRLRWRRRFARRAGRLMARLAGIRLAVRGLEHLGGARPRVVVANHQSYLDAYVLTAALPPDLAFVAKRELAGNPFARAFLARLGTFLVERFDPQQGSEDAGRAVAAVRAGESLLFFAEGTFGRAPGLLPFQLGAFVTAAEAGAPVVPVAVRGTRSLLRGEEWFPRRGAAEVIVRPPIAPGGAGWSAALALRDAVRAEVLAACGEPDLAPPERLTARAAGR
ncbi:MAG TPA: AMP-binding protein [Thermoanaerobaculia bacterium]